MMVFLCLLLSMSEGVHGRISAGAFFKRAGSEAGSQALDGGGDIPQESGYLFEFLLVLDS
jgi:hypothetical protein